MTVLVFGAGRLPPAQRRLIARAARAGLGRAARRRGELCVIFVSDREMRRINRQFLRHDYATDVLAFPYSAELPGRADDAPFGDVYIAWGVARRQAKEQSHPLLAEILTLAAHGALHLVGYDDRKPAGRRRMFAVQERIVRELMPKKARSGARPRPRSRARSDGKA